MAWILWKFRLFSLQHNSLDFQPGTPCVCKASVCLGNLFVV